MNGAGRAAKLKKAKALGPRNAIPSGKFHLRIPFSLLLITDRKATAGIPLQAAVATALSGGIDAVLLRDKDLPIRERLTLARALRALTREHRASFIISASVDLCLAVDADGVHLPEDGLPVSAARRILGPRKLIGASTHSLAGLRAACRDGADYATLGPVFATPSKAAFGPPLGLDAFAEACREAPLPTFALGGVTCDRLGAVLSSGAAGAAMISAVLASPDPRSAARAFVERFAALRKQRERV